VSPSTANATTRARRTYVQRPTAHRRSAGLPNLHYYGGHVLSHVKVDVVVWNSWSYPKTVPLRGTRSISSFFTGITASSYLDMLREYNTPTQKINRGTLEGVYTVRPPAADDGAYVTGAQIADGLRVMIASGKLPRPTTNRLYAIFFRSGQTIVTPDGDSANDFCAYHDTMTYKSSTAYYAVMPYEVGNVGCKAASTWFNSLTTVVSHELVESITDPGVGLNRLSWYDGRNGEIGDICAGPGSSVLVTGGNGVRFAVQRQWSNQAHACIVSD
jgi:hypothetical protein